MKAWQTASRMLNDSDDADDVASETMLRLWAVHDT
ncbi:sigma factor, partial [Sinorhizobium sp. GL28]